MKLKTRRAQTKSNVDMTPMLDVVFQLIIFFLVSTTFSILPGIKLNLPQSRTAEGTNTMGLTITAQSNGNLYFNDKQVSIEELKGELASFETGDVSKEDFPISLEADSDVTNGTVVSLFDVIRECGFSMINLRTTSEKK